MIAVSRQSILGKLRIVVSCTLAALSATSPILAQHVTSPAAGAVHISPPPISHVPVAAAPVVHPPIIRTPMIYTPIIQRPISTPRISRVSSAGAISMSGFPLPRRPVRPLPIWILYQSPFLLGNPFWGFNSCWWTTCDFFWPWLGYTSISSPGPTTYVQTVYETPYVYGEEGPELPQLFLKDGTILSVTDYWLVDGQLHFTIIEEEGAKPTERAIPFESLDLQKTVDANTRRGFHFMLRNEPVERYIRDHAEGTPPTPHD